jgi:hypothetical protein
MAESAGPTRNARPNAAPIIPIFLARVSGVEISDIYACITENPDPHTPLNIRETKNIKNQRLIPEMSDPSGTTDHENSLTLSQSMLVISIPQRP